MTEQLKTDLLKVVPDDDHPIHVGLTLKPPRKIDAEYRVSSARLPDRPAECIIVTKIGAVSDAILAIAEPVDDNLPTSHVVMGIEESLLASDALTKVAEATLEKLKDEQIIPPIMAGEATVEVDADPNDLTAVMHALGEISAHPNVTFEVNPSLEAHWQEAA